ncbi:MAG TPA: hypothetical protein ENK91_12370, partial [Bacteroidetes bacterium]|nr:hypothetical protein [Bacteroidota bacterium]
MKKQLFFYPVLVLYLLVQTIVNLDAQDNLPKKIAVLSVKAENVGLNSTQLTKILRNSLIELDTFEVLDEYDMMEFLKNKDINPEECLSTKCLVEAGKLLKVDYMLSGSVEKLLDKIIISLRMVDVNQNRIYKQKLIEFIDVEKRIKEMLKVSLSEMVGKHVDEALKNALIKENQYASTINIPDVEKLSLAGPRIGMVFFTGTDADIIKAPEEVGGFDGRPFYFQFGYQFEISYLNAGKIQALFEIIPMISGVDQGVIIPSLTLLNGVRLNTNGFELAIGPSFILSKKADGYYDDSGNWVVGNIPDGKIKRTRLDSRGDPYLDTGLVIGFGKSFKSG